MDSAITFSQVFDELYDPLIYIAFSMLLVNLNLIKNYLNLKLNTNSLNFYKF